MMEKAGVVYYYHHFIFKSAYPVILHCIFLYALLPNLKAWHSRSDQCWHVHKSIFPPPVPAWLASRASKRPILDWNLAQN